MISKNKLWKKIRLELKEIAQSEKRTVAVMNRIRKIKDVDNKILPSENH